MPDDKRELTLEERKERVRTVTEAIVLGHIDAILSKRKELLALPEEELEHLSSVLSSTRLAGNGCCTGG